MCKLINIALICILTFLGLHVQAQERDEYRDQDKDKDNREMQTDNKAGMRGDQAMNNRGMAMDTSRNDYARIEQTQDEIEKTQLEIYTIVQNHPEFTYTYDLQDSTVTAVNIEGVSDEQDERALEMQLLRLAELRQDIQNQSNRTGIYYVSEQEPKPKEGYDELYEDIYASIEYPDAAEDTGLEGNVYVKFVVDHEGNVENLIATTDLQPNASEHFASTELVEEAKEAVKNTSGQWEPAKIDGVPVAQWMVLPVQFRLEVPPSLEPLVMEDDFDEDYE